MSWINKKQLNHYKNSLEGCTVQPNFIDTDIPPKIPVKDLIKSAEYYAEEEVYKRLARYYHLDIPETENLHIVITHFIEEMNKKVKK